MLDNMSSITKTYNYRHAVDLSLFETEQDKQNYIKDCVAEFIKELPFEIVQSMFNANIHITENKKSTIKMTVKDNPKQI